jgi:glucosylceramidase
MKLPINGVRSMLSTAKPNGLDPEMQRPYANYFSRFISAYKKHGIDIWGVTVQNEAEAGDVGWEKCLWTPEFQAQFVKKHLCPVLRADHPGTKIIGFDHNKDHGMHACRARSRAVAVAHVASTPQLRPSSSTSVPILVLAPTPFLCPT